MNAAGRAPSEGGGGPVAPADLLIERAAMVATVDDFRREIPGGWVAIRDGVIDAVGGPGAEPPARARLDASGCLVTPGLVNVHHHLWQNLTRAYSPMTTTDFLGWLGALYPLWSRIDAEAIHLSTKVGLLELALGGCTTTSDHLYLQPPDEPSLVEVEIEAALEVGLRFHATRGAVDRGRRDGSPMPDHMLESIDGVLAERLDVRLHTHLSGDSADEGYCLDLHGRRPVEWFESLGWSSRRTWVAHCLFPSPEEIARLGAAGVGVAHCATAALIMGVGVAPVVELRAAGAPVGIGVDGSSNSDAASMWMEARMAMIANRFRSGPAAFGARDALELATRGGADCLGRAGEIGVLAPGANADVAVWPVEGLLFAGAISDPIDAWMRCGPSAPRDLFVAGRAIVSAGRLAVVEPGALDDLLRRHRAAARRLQAC